MAKPTIGNSRWATSSTNITAPSSGQRDSGIVVGAATVSSYVNYLWNQFYLWFSWLDTTFNSSGNLAASQTMLIPGSAFRMSDSAKQWARNADAQFIETDSSGSYTAYCPLILPAGINITGVSVYLNTAVDSGVRAAHLIEAQNFVGGHIDALTSASSSANSSNVTLTLTSTPYTTIAGRYYQIAVTFRSFDQIDGAVITYTLP